MSEDRSIGTQLLAFAIIAIMGVIGGAFMQSCVTKRVEAKADPKPAPLTLESLAAGLTQEILRQSNNWMVVTAVLQQFDKRLQAVEAKLASSVAIPGPLGNTLGLTNPPVIPPLQSAPVIPGVKP